MDNREEVIAVKFSGCMKNAGEMLILAMMNSGQSWDSKYPGIERLRDIKAHKEAYYLLMHFTQLGLLNELRRPREELSREEMVTDLTLLSNFFDPYSCAMTTLEIGLREIAKYPWCKNIVIYDTSLNDIEKNYIAGLFKGLEDKVLMYEGFLKELIVDEDANITTFFVDDVEDLMASMEYYEGIKETSKLAEKQFFVQALNCIEENENPEDKEVKYKYQQYMKDANTRFNANVTYIISHFVDMGDSVK